VLKSPGYTELDKRLQYEVNLAAAAMHFEDKASAPMAEDDDVGSASSN
jgi:hypothetical protein